MGNMASMLTNYNLPLKVVVSTFNACVCNVHGARTIDNLRFMIQHLKIKTSFDVYCSILKQQVG
jgi:hypothetical protein